MNGRLDSLQISDHDVHLWAVDLLAIRPLAARIELLLSAEERARAWRFTDDVRRQQFVLTRGALRTVLEAYGIDDADRIRLAYGNHGKPGLDPAYRSALQFNVSYRSNFALLGMTFAGAIGVDLEWLRPMPLADQIVQDQFSPEEQAAYEALATGERLAGFFRAWTRKEAFLKAQGDGLGRPLASFAVSLGPAEEARLISIHGLPEEHLQWTLADVPVAADYQAAVAIKSNGPLTIVHYSLAPMLRANT